MVCGDDDVLRINCSCKNRITHFQREKKIVREKEEITVKKIVLHSLVTWLSWGIKIWWVCDFYTAI